MKVFWHPSVLAFERSLIELSAFLPCGVRAHAAARWSITPVPSSSVYMTPAETGISLPLARSVPSMTASLCARILLPTCAVPLAVLGASAAPVIASTAIATSSAKQGSVRRPLKKCLSNSPPLAEDAVLEGARRGSDIAKQPERRD